MLNPRKTIHLLRMRQYPHNSLVVFESGRMVTFVCNINVWISNHYIFVPFPFLPLLCRIAQIK